MLFAERVAQRVEVVYVERYVEAGCMRLNARRAGSRWRTVDGRGSE